MSRKITGVSLILEFDDNGKWLDATELMPDEFAEPLEVLLDGIEEALNENLHFLSTKDIH